MVQAWGGLQLAEAAREALIKIEAALPADLKREIDRSRLFALDLKVGAELQAAFDPLAKPLTNT